MTRPRPAILVLGAGALALAIGTVGIATAGSGMHVESVGARPAVAAEAPLASSPGSTTPDVDDAQDSASPYRTLERVDATALPRPDRTPRPVQIRIPAIDVRTAVDVVGLDVAGQVQVPEDVSRAGWYRFSSKPGSGEGSTVIVAHVDGVDQGAGVFYDLRKVRPGDTVTVTRADDRTMTYEVVAREVFDKDRVPLRELFSRSGPERLTLITCGGPFDPASLEYTDNVVVTAVPVDSAEKIGETR
ncbi:MAG: class F sortase [Candidatus Nanopelagicales bacterium]